MNKVKHSKQYFCKQCKVSTLNYIKHCKTQKHIKKLDLSSSCSFSSDETNESEETNSFAGIWIYSYRTNTEDYSLHSDENEPDPIPDPRIPVMLLQIPKILEKEDRDYFTIENKLLRLIMLEHPGFELNIISFSF